MINYFKRKIPLELKIALKKLFTKQTKKFIFNGIYENINQISEINNGYDNLNWLKYYKIDCIDKYNSIINDTIYLKPLTNIHNLFQLMYSCYPKKEVSILDFGGGFGTNFLDTLKSKDKACCYDIVDRLETIKLAKDLPYANHLNFYTEIPIKKYDIVYCGSVLQYIENYKETIIELCNNAEDLFFITDNFLGFAKTFATAQCNMASKQMGYWIFNEKELISLIEKSGFKLIYKSINYQPFHNMSNFPDDKRVDHTTNLLFKRINFTFN